MLCRWVHTTTLKHTITQTYIAPLLLIKTKLRSCALKINNPNTSFFFGWIIHQSLLVTANPIQSIGINVDELTYKTHLSVSDRVNLPMPATFHLSLSIIQIYSLVKYAQFCPALIDAFTCCPMSALRRRF